MASRLPQDDDDSTIHGLIQAEKVLRGIEHHWPADSVAQAIAELRSLHKIHATKVNEDGVVEEYEIDCPEDSTCAVWHECKVEGCEPPEDAYDAEEGDTRHGLPHQYIDYSWMSKDAPHNCATQYVEDWPEMEEGGSYTFQVDYGGEDYWGVYGFEEVRSLRELCSENGLFDDDYDDDEEGGEKP